MNKSKCVILVKLVGREAASIISKHSCWVIDAKSSKVKGWRLGPNKGFPALVGCFNQVSWGHHLVRSLRNADLAAQDQRSKTETPPRAQVCLQPPCCRHQGQVEGLGINCFQHTTDGFVRRGSCTGIGASTAQLARSQSSLCLEPAGSYQPRHHEGSLCDFALHHITDPVDLVLARLRKLLKKLEVKPHSRPDITTSISVLQCLREKIEVIEKLPQPDQDPAQVHACDICGAAFESAHGAHMHKTKQHPQSVPRFIPTQFDRPRHAIDGLPKCAACHYFFKQWKGLRDHLLSGACPKPEVLQQLTEADAQSTSPETEQLAALRTALLGLPRHQLGHRVGQTDAALLNHRCLVCNFWAPDRTKVKSHFRQAHPRDWARLHPAAVSICRSYAAQTMKWQQCPFCYHNVHDRQQHPEQCPVLYQVVSHWLRCQTELPKLQTGHSPRPSECTGSSEPRQGQPSPRRQTWNHTCPLQVCNAPS